MEANVTIIHSPHRDTMREMVSQAISQHGSTVTPLSGRGQPKGAILGLTGVWTGRCSVRTTQDRWASIGEDENGWRTLDDVDWVAVAALDDKRAPSAVDIYFFAVQDFRAAFDEAKAARVKAGQALTRGGVWVALDKVDSDRATAVASGFKDKALWHVRYPLSPVAAAVEGPPDTQHATGSATLSIAQAKPLLAAHYGVGIESIEILIRG